MLREQAKVLEIAHKFLDIVLTAVAFVGAYWIKRNLLPAQWGGLSTGPNYYIVLLLVVIVWYLVFSAAGLYASYRRRDYSRIFFDMAKAVSTSMLVLLVLLYALKIQDVSRLMLGIFYLLDLLLLAASKGLVYRLLAYYRGRGYNFRNLLIVGSREQASKVLQAIGKRLGAGYRVIGCLEIEPQLVGQTVKSGCPVIGTLDDLKPVLERETVDELVFAMPLRKIPEIKRHVGLAQEMGVAVRIVPDWRLEAFARPDGRVNVRFEDFLGIATLSLDNTPPAKEALMVKAAIDYAVAGVLMIPCLPLFAVIAAAIKIASPGGPVFYRQERCGLNGRRFQLLKFRTMVPGADRLRDRLAHCNECDGPVFKIHRDPRIIPWVGHFLRKTSLDELPQLINVLRGEMSLVGPRPPIPAEVAQYDTWQRRRLSMKPGLTCIWQTAPRRNEVPFKEWMKMDLAYIDNWSLGLDFKLLARTALVVLLGYGR